VDPSGPAIDLHVPLMIIIGTIPLHSVVQQYQTQFGVSGAQYGVGGAGPSGAGPAGPGPSALPPLPGPEPSAPPVGGGPSPMMNLRE
jgi:hypothetical protein